MLVVHFFFFLRREQRSCVLSATPSPRPETWGGCFCDTSNSIEREGLALFWPIRDGLVGSWPVVDSHLPPPLPPPSWFSWWCSPTDPWRRASVTSDPPPQPCTIMYAPAAIATTSEQRLKWTAQALNMTNFKKRSFGTAFINFVNLFFCFFLGKGFGLN